MKFSDGTSGFWGMGVYQVNTTISTFTKLSKAHFDMLGG